MPNASDDTPADTADTAASTPPWGDDFDAARAWSTITSQREAEQALKAEIAALKTAAESLVPRADLDAAIARADAAETAAKSTKRDAALAKAELPEELHAFVTAEDEEGIADQIAKLRAAITPPSSDNDDDTSGKTPAPKRPESGLTPGHGGEEAPVFDPNAIASAIRG